MPLLTFSVRDHVELIKTGQKKQSTRSPRKLPLKLGAKLFCYYKSRMKKGTCVNCICFDYEDQDCVAGKACPCWTNFFGVYQIVGILHCNSAVSDTVYQDYTTAITLDFSTAIFGKGFERNIASLGYQSQQFMEEWAIADGFKSSNASQSLNDAHAFFTKSTGTSQWMFMPWTIILFEGLVKQ